MVELQIIAIVLTLFFAVLIAGAAASFVVLRTAGVAPERIGRGAARVVRVLSRIPGLHRFAAFSRRHRKAVGLAGTVLAIGLAPFALMGAGLVVAALTVVFSYGLLAKQVPADSEDDDGYFLGSLVIGYNGDLVPRGSAEAKPRF